MKTYKVGGGMNPLILNIGSG